MINKFNIIEFKSVFTQNPQDGEFLSDMNLEEKIKSYEYKEAFIELLKEYL